MDGSRAAQAPGTGPTHIIPSPGRGVGFAPPGLMKEGMGGFAERNKKRRKKPESRI
jgi:hypothetical protein